MGVKTAEAPPPIPSNAILSKNDLLPCLRSISEFAPGGGGVGLRRPFVFASCPFGLCIDSQAQDSPNRRHGAQLKPPIQSIERRLRDGHASSPLCGWQWD